MTILIVDDNDDIRLFLYQLIRKTFRCEIAEAANGKEALDKLPEVHPDIICLDVSMPVMDGVTFIEKMKQLPEFADTHVIMMSAISEKATIARLLRLGIKHYILKPFSFSDTQMRLKDIIFPILKENKDKLFNNKKD